MAETPKVAVTGWRKLLIAAFGIVSLSLLAVAGHADDVVTNGIVWVVGIACGANAVEHVRRLA